jgi:deoxyribodipyrimidine photo-lyase
MRIGLWFRLDLRLADHPALAASLQANALLPFYIFPEAWRFSAAQSLALWSALQALRADLHALSSDLLLFQGDPEILLPKIVHSYALEEVCWTRRYTPQGIEKDQKIKSLLQGLGCRVSSFPGQVLIEPWLHLKKDGTPYRVFTPFYKAQPLEKIGEVLRPPQNLPPLPSVVDRHVVPLPWPTVSFEKSWQQRLWQVVKDAFSAAALFKQKSDFAEKVVDYGQKRDYPAQAATSGLSAALALGRVSVREVFCFYQKIPQAEPFLRQLFWREFAYHLLYHFPQTESLPLDARFQYFPWQNNLLFLKAWQQGQTGIPLVDAGMRQLWQEGRLHNRLRMVVGSFLVKNLLLPWQWGAAWFAETLFDFDLANNTLGWQWVAGCGADAAPYFRIFNPVLQAEKFDSEGEYIRRYLPELNALPKKFLFAPWLAPAPPSAYPKPIVDLAASRLQALAALKTMQAATAGKP